MYGYRYREKYKWKNKVVTAAYIAFLLASFGELFVFNGHILRNAQQKSQYSEVIEIPKHLPEKVGEHRFKPLMVCIRQKDENSVQKCYGVFDQTENLDIGSSIADASFNSDVNHHTF